MNIKKKTYPTMALVGRTNVGKSTLFNRLIEQGKAIVSEEPGTTRDRITGLCLWRGRAVTMVDTGGQDVGRQASDIDKQIVTQAKEAQREADVIFFVVDGTTGPLQEDRIIAKSLRGSKVPVLVIVNKCESPRSRTSEALQKFSALGFDAWFSVSAKTGVGVGDALDAAYEALQKAGKYPPDYQEPTAVRVAFIGKPNVGKSSIVNAILGEERCIVSPTPHTTREPDDIEINWKGTDYVLVDTAGLRRLSKVTNPLTKEGMEKTLKTIERSDVVFLVIDISEPPTNDDKHLAGLIKDSKKGCALIANKWDLVPDKHTNSTTEFEEILYYSFPFFAFAPVAFISAKEKQRTAELLDLAAKIEIERNRMIDENALMRFFKKSIAEHRPARGKGPKHPYLYRMRQIGVKPPKFLLTIKGRAETLHYSYLRFLENKLREKFGFKGTPIIIVTEEVSMAPRTKAEKNKKI